MAQPTPEIRDEAMALIERLRSGLLDDSEISEVVVRLHKLLPDPHFMGYTIDHVPDLSDAEIIDRAFLYRPIIL